MRSIGLLALVLALTGCGPCRGVEGPSEPLFDDEAVRVPRTSYVRGAQPDDPAAPGHDPDALPPEGPPTEVTVGPFWIHLDEVPAEAWDRCVDEGGCPAGAAATGGFNTSQVPSRLKHPITGVTWAEAQGYCASLGGRLPTEDEWELAARGTDGRRFPWGDSPHCGIASPPTEKSWQLDQVWTGPCPADGTRAPMDLRGHSAFRLTGMGGNVAEWVDGWFVRDVEPGAGAVRVTRGGSWVETDPLALRAAARSAMLPEERTNDIGFRCVFDEKPARWNYPHH